MNTTKKVKKIVSHITLAVLGFFWVLPIFYVLLTSFRAEGGSYKSYIWPKGFTLDNYAALFQGNSIINFNYKNASKELVDIFHENDLLVSIWTVDSEYNMYKILSFGPDNITTRHPDKLSAIVSQKN